MSGRGTFSYRGVIGCKVEQKHFLWGSGNYSLIVTSNAVVRCVLSGCCANNKIEVQ
jgi:hypothetical protein